MPDEKIQVAFVNTEQMPLYTRHICYKVDSKTEEVSLMEVYESYFPHPEAPALAKVSVVGLRHVRTYQRTDPKAAALLLLEAAMNNTMNLYENTIRGLLPGVEHQISNC